MMCSGEASGKREYHSSSRLRNRIVGDAMLAPLIEIGALHVIDAG